MIKKRYTAVLFLAVLFIETARAQEISSLQKVLELNMPLTQSDDMPGTRGASLVWHPVQKKYYATFAGNAEYPLAVFARDGKRLSSVYEKARFDCRGLWYDAASGKICGNAYKEIGWFSYELTAPGMIQDVTTIIEGMQQPDAQSVGAYNPVTRQVLFLDVNTSAICQYTADGLKIENDRPTMLQWSTVKNISAGRSKEALLPEGYNTTTLVYTGYTDAEIGVLNYSKRTVELYSLKTGLLRKKLVLPNDAPVESMFNFAFSNNLFWLFDMKKRIWFGYQ